MSAKLLKNLQAMDLGPNSETPYIIDMDYYLFENFTADCSLSLNTEYEETTTDFATTGEGFYTNGGEFIVSQIGEQRPQNVVKELYDIGSPGLTVGSNYIGPYHVMEGSSGEIIYMTGDAHENNNVDAAQLKPVALKVILPIGDVAEYNTTSLSSDKPFILEKYIFIEGYGKLTSSQAISICTSQDQLKSISDIFPGTMSLIESNGVAVGITGDLGIRYGLEFSVNINNQKYFICDVEINALDTLMSAVQSFEGNSKMLLCLIKKLQKVPEFKLTTKYILSLTKFPSLAAIYNDMGFLPSIGEVTVEKGAARGVTSTFASKPGLGISTDGDEINETQLSGWASYSDRNRIFKGAGWFNKKYDEWDWEILAKSNNRIKKIFKSFYFRRDFKLGDFGADLDPGSQWLRRLKEGMRPAQGDRLLPRWQKRRLRRNPFNVNDKICDE